MRVAYLINRYPAASHSFIRREIEAIEGEGAKVDRYSIRPVDASLLRDPRDLAERKQTVVLLQLGLPRLVIGTLRVGLRRPLRGISGLRLALRGCSWRPLDIVRRTAYFLEAAILAERMVHDGVDHLHAHFGTNPATVARIASKLSGIPYSFTVHGPDEFDAPIALDLRGKVDDCAFCVAISSFGRSQIMRWSAYSNWPKIKVVRCGVDETFLADRDNAEITRAPRLCTVARLSGQKGIPLLLEASARLKSAGHTFHLTVVGDGELRGEMEALIRHHGLSEFVELAGLAKAEEVVRHLNDARAMVLPSFAEGLPVVIMEALALRRPVIVSAVAGTPELVDVECGWLVPAGSVEKLAEAMQEALEATPVQLLKKGEIGRARVMRMHDAAINGQELLGHIKGSLRDDG